MSSVSPIIHNIATSTVKAAENAVKSTAAPEKLGQEVADEFARKTGSEAAQGDKKGFFHSIGQFFSSIGKQITELFNKFTSFFSSNKATAVEATESSATETAAQTTSQEAEKETATATHSSPAEKTDPNKQAEETTPEETSLPKQPQAVAEEPKATSSQSAAASTEEASSQIETPKTVVEETKVTAALEKSVAPETAKNETPEASILEQDSQTAPSGVEHETGKSEAETSQATIPEDTSKSQPSKKGKSNKVSLKKTAMVATLAAAAGKIYQSPGASDIAMRGAAGMHDISTNLAHTAQTNWDAYFKPNSTTVWDNTFNQFGNLHPRGNTSFHVPGLDDQVFHSGAPVLNGNGTQYVNVTIPHTGSSNTSSGQISQTLGSLDDSISQGAKNTSDAPLAPQTPWSWQEASPKDLQTVPPKDLQTVPPKDIQTVPTQGTSTSTKLGNVGGAFNPATPRELTFAEQLNDAVFLNPESAGLKGNETLSNMTATQPATAKAAQSNGYSYPQFLPDGNTFAWLGEKTSGALQGGQERLSQAKQYGQEKLKQAHEYGSSTYNDALQGGQERLSQAKQYGQERLKQAHEYGSSTYNDALQGGQERLSQAKQYGQEKLKQAHEYGSSAYNDALQGGQYYLGQARTAYNAAYNYNYQDQAKNAYNGAIDLSKKGIENGGKILGDALQERERLLRPSSQVMAEQSAENFRKIEPALQQVYNDFTGKTAAMAQQQAGHDAIKIPQPQLAKSGAQPSLPVETISGTHPLNTATPTQTHNPINTQGSQSTTAKHTSVGDAKTPAANVKNHPTSEKSMPVLDEDEFFDAKEYQ